MTWSRTIAILVGIVISLACGNLFGINWYVSFAIGIVGYFVTRYVLWAIADQRRLKGELDQFIKDYHDEQPLNADVALAEYDRWTALDQVPSPHNPRLRFSTKAVQRFHENGLP